MACAVRPHAAPTCAGGCGFTCDAGYADCDGDPVDGCEADLRGTVDERDERIGRKIRDAEMQKIPYLLVVGEKEVENGQIAVRRHGEGDQGSITVDAFIRNFQEQVEAMMSGKAVAAHS